MPLPNRSILHEAPPKVVPWDQFYRREARENRQGQHRLFVGPTQSGKTVLCRKLAALRGAVVVFGTKAKDPSLDAYIIEGYHRIDHWPPTRDDIKKATLVDGTVRLILWPEIRQRSDLRKPSTRDMFMACMDQAFVEGRWTIVADEGLWISSRTGLDLGGPLSDLAYGSASNDVSLYLCLQRPSSVPRITWQSVTDAYIFKSGVDTDLRELSSLGMYERADAKRAIQQLGRADGKDAHPFLKLPCRAGAKWEISEVSPEAVVPRPLG